MSDTDTSVALTLGPESRADLMAGTTPLTLEQAVALARYATNKPALRDIVRRLPSGLRKKGRSEIEEVAPLADNKETEAILASQNWSQVFGLFEAASNEGVAARLLDWVAERRGLRDFNTRAASLARSFPGSLTPERIQRLAEACLKADSADLDPGMLVPLLLEKNAFSSADLITLYKKSSFSDTSKSIRALIVHERATPELWVAIVSRSLPDGPLVGEHMKKYMREFDDLRILMNHAPAMAVPEVGDRLVENRDLANAFGGIAHYLRHLKRKLPAGFPFERGQATRIIEELFAGDVVSALDTISHMPTEWRRFVSRDRIADLAATHPDGRVRQAAILFTTPVGDEIKVRRSRKRAS